MEGAYGGWWRRHGWTVAILLAMIGISFAIRTIWQYPIVAQYGPLYTYAGGSDSYYHSRVMTYIIATHTNLVHDPLLNFPVGSVNPREPLFDWMNAILGIVFAPVFGGSAVTAGAWFLDFQSPFWAALGVVPVYLIGREVANRRVGLIAAVIFPFLSANIDSSVFGYADYLSFYTFFLLVTIYAYLRMAKSVGSRRWVESYRHPSQYWPGLRAFLRTERTTVKWAVFTGVSLGAFALAWQGYTYAVVVIGISVLISMFAERVRHVDSFGLYVSTWIVGLVAFPMELPYYLTQYGTVSSGGFETYWLLQALLFFGVLLILLPFLLMRDVPWVVSIPMLVGLVLAGIGGLAVVDHSLFTTLITGQGYFVKTLIYSTVAEAQAPSIDALVVGYGVVTFFLAFFGLAIFVYLLVRGRFKRHHVVFVVFAVISLYLPISATKFFLVGSPIFALLPAEAIRRALDIGNYPELRRTTVSLSDRRSRWWAFRRAFKARHVLILILVVGLLLPNVWSAIDAGIPGNTKTQFAEQVAATLPPWLQLNTTAPGSYYFGAAGSSLDTPNLYDSAGYNWLAAQDTNEPVTQRPAVISWWDYGFQTLDQGDHPSVANNFQQGIDPGGQFLLAQNESQAIADLTTTLLLAEQTSSGQTDLPSSLNLLLISNGVNVTKLHAIISDPAADYRTVVANPQLYLPVNPSTLTDLNAEYMAANYLLSSTLSLSGVAQLYDSVMAYTGWSIGYDLTDSRLFPFSGSDTGIYYAPAELTGRVVDSSGVPLTYFNVTITGSDGNTYPLGQLPADVGAVNYNINYFAPFYNSMIYRTYIGYNGTDVGLGEGIPGLEGSSQLLDSPLMPGWMLQHFEVVYQTAYYCPQNNATSGSPCFSAENLPTAVAQQKASGGTVDTSAGSYFSGGESFLMYYPGQTLLGTVTLPNGAPVGGAQVTIADGRGIPHMTTHTAPDGSFSLVLPPGDDTLNITTGAEEGLYQQGNTTLDSISLDVSNASAMSLTPLPMSRTFTLAPASVQGFVYWNANNTTGYVPSADRLLPGAQVLIWGTNGTVRRSITADVSGSFDLTNVAPGSYQVNVLYGGYNFTEPSIYVAPGVATNLTLGLTPGRVSGTVRDASGAPVPGATVALGNSTGVIATVVANDTGSYSIASAGPGNYTVTATGPTVGYRSPGALVAFPTVGSSASVNLTETAMSTVSFSVTANGAPAAGIPVRFVPLAAYANASASPIGALEDSTTNGTTFTSSSSGTVAAALPAGAYSVYALGYVGTSLYTAVEDLAVGPGIPSLGPTLTLAPSLTLSGTVVGGGSASSGTETAVVAYASNGGEVVTWARANGTFSVLLPNGTYSLLTLTGTSTTSGTSVLAGLVSVDLVPGVAPVVVTPTAAVVGHFRVGSILSSGEMFPAAEALVTVSAPTAGAAVPVLASATGNVTVYVPGKLPLAGAYCVAVQSAGFSSTSECDLTPTHFAEVESLPLALENVSVRLTVEGLPSGARTVVNFTAESPSATNFTFTGGTTFTFEAPPGTYGVGAWASIASNTTIYLPPTILSTTLPLGAVQSNLTLILIPKVPSKGTLALTPSVATGNVTITLSSPVLNETVNGTAYTKGFYAAPGTYSALASFSYQGTNYTNLSRVTVSSSGTITPTISVSVPGTTLAGEFLSGGNKVPLNTTVSLVGPGGVTATVTATSGAFSVSAPSNVPYAVFANGTILVSGPNGSFYRTYSVVPGSTCSGNSTSPSCSVPVVGTDVPWWVNGTVSSPGLSGPFTGTAYLVGPYPSLAQTTVSVSNSAFSALVAPGAYSVYVVGSGGAVGRAGFASALALPLTGRPVSVSLAPAWTATLSVSYAAGSLASVGPVTFVLRSSTGQELLFTGVSPYATVQAYVPAGTYTVRANSTAPLYGAPTNVSGTASVVVVQGNVGAVVSLQYAVSYAVAAPLASPTAVTVSAGTAVSFAFSVRDVGTEPVTIAPRGSPSYWQFNFSFAQLSLTPGPSGATVSAEVQIYVPAGTPVNHPGVSIQFVLANGTVAGSVTPGPTINIRPVFGIAVGGSPSLVSQVGVATVVQPFYVTDTGNTFESATLAVSNAGVLASDGWSVTITTTSDSPTRFANLSAGQNATFYVHLNATGSVFLPPANITVTASVLNSSGTATASGTIRVPFATVHAPRPPSVTGPSVGTTPPLPDWVVPLLVFVPTFALVIAILVVRWWRTRRWSRR